VEEPEARVAAARRRAVEVRARAVGARPRAAARSRQAAAWTPEGAPPPVDSGVRSRTNPTLRRRRPASWPRSGRWRCTVERAGRSRTSRRCWPRSDDIIGPGRFAPPPRDLAHSGAV